MSLGSKSSPEEPATPMQKALASEAFRARLPSRRSGRLGCAAPANCSEDRAAQAIWRRWEGTVTAKTSVMRPQDTRHTHITYTHVYTGQHFR